MTQATKLTLFSYWRSSSSYRVRIALELAGLAYAYRAVHLVKNGWEQHSDEFIQLNPKGEVPFLVDHDVRLSQSLAIIKYLDEKYLQDRLFRSGKPESYKVLEICEIINSGIQPIQNLNVLKNLQARFKVSDDSKANWIRDFTKAGFIALERQLEDFHGPFCLGTEISAADLFLIPQMYNARRFSVKLDAFPRLV